MTTEVLYIHGFASSPNSWKANLLKEYFQKQGYENVFVPQIPVSPLKAIDFLKEIYDSKPLKLVVGSSLGGFYALYLAQFFDIKTILINPAIKPSQTLDFEGPVKRHNSDEFFLWTKDHVNQLEELENDLNINKINQQNLYFYLSRDDEILDHSQIPELFPQAHIQFFDDCKHAFTCFESILNQIFNIYLS